MLADRNGARLRRGRELALVAEVVLAGRRMALAVPLTYYNESGLAAARLVRRFGIADPRRLVVVHDELDLPVGRIRVKVGGGLAGNRGLRSITEHLRTDDFVRVRIGVGKPPGTMTGTDHVLRRPGKAERAELDVSVQLAADAVEVICLEGPEAAMNRFNRR